MYPELIHQIALTKIPTIGDVHRKTLINLFGDASTIFKTPLRHLEKIDGIGKVRASKIKSFEDYISCEEEIEFIDKYKIQPLFITSPDYPKRLANCYDCPTLLYYRGSTNLNAEKIISVVGTRNNTHYGKMICEKLIEGFQKQSILVVSGLAFGIDTIAHKSALQNDLNSVGVLAHGLDRMYPSQNKLLAKKMMSQGGLLTDFMSNTNPDKQNFPRRNRIVAGICDALVVVESNARGGSLITAEIANSYNKDIFAMPGRIGDVKSEGCNFLIKSNKAALITSANDLFTNMNWMSKPGAPIVQQKELFAKLGTVEQKLLSILTPKNKIHIDEIYCKTSLNNSVLAQALLNLEINGMIHSLPGKYYQLI